MEQCQGAAPWRAPPPAGTAPGFYNPPNGPRLVHGEGVYAFSEDGAEYLDAGSGTFNLSLGYSHPRVVAALQSQSERLIHGSGSFTVDAVEELVRRLLQVSPPNLRLAHVKSSGGSTANEGAVKLARRFTGGRDIVTLFRSHHGQTALTAAMSGQSFRHGHEPAPLSGIIHVPDPYCFRCFYRQRRDTCGLLCVDRIADFIDHAGSGSVACCIVEPVSGNGGNIPVPDGYLAALRSLCDERQILLVVDEIQTGIGRTGTMFAIEHSGVRSDILTVGKGLGGSGAQVAAILTEERLAGMASEEHSFTYGGNVLAAAAAAATLDVIARPGFLEHVRQAGDYLAARLADIATRYPCIGDVRGIGLMHGLEIVNASGGRAAPLTRAIADTALSVGLLLRTSEYGRGNVVKVRPPLVITLPEVDVLCERLDRSLGSVAT